MAQTKGPLPGVYISSGRYYRQIRRGAKKVWVPLTRVDEGLAALHQALAAMLAPPAEDGVPRLIELWEREELQRLAAKTQTNLRRLNVAIGTVFAEARAVDVQPPHIVEYLRAYRDRPRTHNAHRAQLRELMRYAELLGWRAPGSNPTLAVRTMSTPARTRYLTDSEVRRIKIGATRGRDGQPCESGPTMRALIEVLYLTAQPIGDVLAMDAEDVKGRILEFRRSKVAGSTGAAVRVRVSDRLRRALDALLAIRAAVEADQLRRRRRAVISPALVVTQDGERARYDGIKTAWSRACSRAGVLDAHIHDLRAKALTDIERLRGMRAARVAGQHATESQTADYVRAREAEVVDATR